MDHDTGGQVLAQVVPGLSAFVAPSGRSVRVERARAHALSAQRLLSSHSSLQLRPRRVGAAEAEELRASLGLAGWIKKRWGLVHSSLVAAERSSKSSRTLRASEREKRKDQIEPTTESLCERKIGRLLSSSRCGERVVILSPLDPVCCEHFGGERSVSSWRWAPVAVVVVVVVVVVA